MNSSVIAPLPCGRTVRVQLLLARCQTVGRGAEVKAHWRADRLQYRVSHPETVRVQAALVFKLTYMQYECS